MKRRKSAAAASNDMRQIRIYFEASEQDVFITFFGGYLWWCHPSGSPVLLPDEAGAKLRRTVDGWKKTSLGGESLLISRLSGELGSVRNSVFKAG